MRCTIQIATQGTLAAAALASCLACGGGGGGASSSVTPPAVYFQVTSYVSDQAGTATYRDPNLVNGWGLAYGPSTPFWVANQGTWTSTVYNGLGVAPPLLVTVPYAAATPAKGPTGIVYNGTSAFSGDAFIFVTLDGLLAGWSSGTTAALRLTVPGAAYTGAATALNRAAPMLYAANFGAGKLDVFDGTYTALSVWEQVTVDAVLGQSKKQKG